MGMRSTIARRTYQKLTSRIRRITSNRRDSRGTKTELRNAGSSVADSRPTIIAGSVGQNLGEEFKKAIKSGEYNQEFGSDTNDGQDDDDDTEEIDRVIKDLNNNRQHSPGGDGDDIFQEIRIRRYKRRSKTLMHGENSPRIPDEHEHRSRFIEEEEIELQDASTDTTDLTTFKTTDTQTDPVPEPPPVYRPKMEDLQVQTDEPTSSTSSKAKKEEEEEDNSLSLLKLVAGIDPINSHQNKKKIQIDHPQKPRPQKNWKEDPNGKALLRRKIRLYTTIIIFLTIIASLILRSSSSSSALSNSGTYKLTNHASSSSSSCILEAIKKSSIDNQDYLLGILSSSSSSPLNTPSPSSNINGPGNPLFMKIIPANSLADLIDFNSVALGKEGFFLNYLKYHFQFFVRLTHFGSHMLWSTVSMYQTNPT
ncbi:hypothetical protein PSHT_01839 [Puccinia striiformis]|uniref:Uncharacterized protein n=1 Tax=Puccinia striiformis TaxID=27350 RepID=A0A2S4WJK8_9BASI|nr:hypothetical protein PSHT_01839 [Puccinia striiformis]